MPATNRLQHAKDFESVFKRGRGVLVDGLFLKLTLTTFPITRLGIVVSKKVSAKAVERNRKRRLLREAIRGYTRELKKGIDAVIVVQPTFEAQNLAETKAIVEKLFRKASLFA
jgi:ribonuclease P protein component